MMKAGGKGDAHDASVGEMQQAVADELARLEAEAPRRRVKGAREKVARTERDLRYAKAELDAALAALKDD